MVNSKKVKIACYSMNISMAVIGNLSPLLFLTFKSLYGISYSLLGLLVLINFVTQLIVDLIFSFFPYKFNIKKVVKVTPILTVIGLLIYAIYPYIFPNSVYVGLVIGTLVFSASSGLAEVLLSPVIAALPSDNPDREMSKLHSIYAWGVVGVIIFGTIFLLLFKGNNWPILAMIFALIPAFSAIMYSTTNLPEVQTPEKMSNVVELLKNKSLWICVLAIFLGGASECTMAQWASSYIEKALNIEKVWGDIFGVALFALTLGLGRTIYAKKGKNIEKVLLLGAIGATICYLTAAITSIAIIGLIACGLTGLCVSMMWPGSLIVSTKKIPYGGVFVFAMMAAGGDFGASVGPQLIGIVTDFVSTNESFINIANNLNLTSDQIGMKCAMLVGMLFPLFAIIVYSILHKSNHKKS